jgi:hypothetical protein
MFPFGGTILLMGVWAGDVVNDATVQEIFVKTTIFPTPIRLNTFNFCVKEKFSMFLETKKSVFNLGFSMKKVGPSEFCEIVNETNIIFESTNRRNCRTPNIGINEL